MIRLTRLLAAVLLVAGGVIHFNLWSDGYRYIPTIGPLFFANFVGSIALGAVLITSRRANVACAGIAFAVGSLVALVLSRTVGVFGFAERIWTTEAIQTIASETGAIVVLGIALMVQRRTAHKFREQPPETVGFAQLQRSDCRTSDAPGAAVCARKPRGRPISLRKPFAPAAMGPSTSELSRRRS